MFEKCFMMFFVVSLFFLCFVLRTQGLFPKATIIIIMIFNLALMFALGNSQLIVRQFQLNSMINGNFKARFS